MKSLKPLSVLLFIFLSLLELKESEAATFIEDKVVNKNASRIRIDNSYSEKSKKVVYSVPVNVKAGQFILITYRFTITNNDSYNKGMGYYLTFGSTPTIVKRGAVFAGASMENCIPHVHHCERSAAYQMVAKKDFKGYINLVGYVVGKGGSITVENSGYLQVSVL